MGGNGRPVNNTAKSMKRGRDNQERRRLAYIYLYHQQVFRLEGEVGGGAQGAGRTRTLLAAIPLPLLRLWTTPSSSSSIFFSTNIFRKYIVSVQLLPSSDRSHSSSQVRFLPFLRVFVQTTCRRDCVCV